MSGTPTPQSNKKNLDHVNKFSSMLMSDIQTNDTVHPKPALLCNTAIWLTIYAYMQTVAVLTEHVAKHAISLSQEFIYVYKCCTHRRSLTHFIRKLIYDNKQKDLCPKSGWVFKFGVWYNMCWRKFIQPTCATPGIWLWCTAHWSETTFYTFFKKNLTSFES